MTSIQSRADIYTGAVLDRVNSSLRDRGRNDLADADITVPQLARASALLQVDVSAWFPLRSTLA